MRLTNLVHNFYFAFSVILFCGIPKSNARPLKADTNVFYFYEGASGQFKQVDNPDSATMVRIILPPDPGEKRFNVKEYSSNGTLKFQGKTTSNYLLFKSGFFTKDGTCVTYYPSGKRQDVCEYDDGVRVGMEYIYYPDGKVYVCLNHVRRGNLSTTTLYWECYGKDGKALCSEGNGQWIDYDSNWETFMTGQIKKGDPDGEWNGFSTVDSIKYICKYYRGRVLSAVGYDKAGVAHPFRDEFENPRYGTEGSIYFAEDFIHNLKLSPDKKKALTDTGKLILTIETDGQMRSAVISGQENNSQLTEAVRAALQKLHQWIPFKHFGVPYASIITMQLNVKSDGGGQSVKYHIKIPRFDNVNTYNRDGSAMRLSVPGYSVKIDN